MEVSVEFPFMVSIPLYAGYRRDAAGGDAAPMVSPTQ